MNFFLMLLNQVILPLVFISLFYNSKTKSRSNFILQFLFTGSFVGFTLTVGSQSWTSAFLGWIIALLFLISIFIKIRTLPKTWAFKIGDNWKEISSIVVQTLLTLLFLPITLYALSGYSFDENVSAINLEFPLNDGIYIVGHGGSNPLINYHNVNESQRYALDILKLNAIGTRSWGAYPEELERYAIFDDTLYSPCDGTVVDMEKGYVDLIPPNRGEGHPAGNHVVIQCGTAEVTIAHMKENSITVDSSQTVKIGDMIGKVGNTGNTSEPHLHIHAEVDGIGIPILFNNRFLVRNSLIWR
ncbi:MAG: M23 family metallopeptidase [Balneola sp.]